MRKMGFERMESHLKIGIRKNVGYEVAVGLVCGVVMGVALEKSRALEPAVIRNQMEGKTMIWLKFVLSGMASSLVSMVLTSLLSPKSWQLIRWDVSRRRRTTSAIAGIFFGFGTALGGVTPATAAAQFGARFTGSGLSFLAGLSGALAFGVLEPWLKTRFKPHAESKKEQDLADEIYSSRTKQDFSLVYRRFAIFAICFTFITTICLEAAFPWPREARRALVALPPNHSARLGRQYGLRAHAWSPQLCGFVLGFAQIPLHMNGVAIETSSGYLTLADSILRLDHRPGRNDLRANAGLIAHAAQLALLFGIAVGAALSARTSTLVFMNPPNSASYLSSPISTFIGTFFVVAAARFARGCEYYHTLTGLASFSLPSFFLTALFFLSGSTTAFLISNLPSSV